MVFFPHIINQTNNASKEANGTECTFFFAPQRHSADQFPITCSDSPHFEEAAHWLYYRGTGRQGLIKLTGVITRPLPCHGSKKRMEQRCDGEGHEAIISQRAQWVFPVTPCRSRFKDWREGPDSDGWWSAADANRANVPWCLRLRRAVCSLDWGTFKGLGWEGHWRFQTFFKAFSPLTQRWIVKCRHFQISGKAYSFLMQLILNHVLKVMII